MDNEFTEKISPQGWQIFVRTLVPSDIAPSIEIRVTPSAAPLIFRFPDKRDLAAFISWVKDNPDSTPLGLCRKAASYSYFNRVDIAEQ